MEIRKIDVFFLEMKLSDDFRTSFGSLSSRPVVLIRVEEKGGEEGWGELVAEWGPWYSYETYEVSMLIIKKFLAPLLINSNIEHPEEFRKIVSTVRGYPMAKTALEEALVDVYSRLERIPLSRLLGGARKEITSGVSIGIKPTLDELLREVRMRLEEGYARIKIKVEPGYDVKPVESIRKEFEEIPLQVDANGAYDLTHLPVFRKLDEFNLLMIEQPLRWDDLIEHSILSRKISTPICLDESIGNVEDLVLGWNMGSLEIVNVKPARVGGVFNAREILDIAGKIGIGAWIGGMLETGIGRAFLVALATHSAVNYPNDISASSRYWSEDIVEPPWTVTSRGTIQVPSGPGIGVEVLFDRIERNSREKWSLVK
ncbi:MAG: o-succinylbenzoate synthase [Infirmifilum sp.]